MPQAENDFLAALDTLIANWPSGDQNGRILEQSLRSKKNVPINVPISNPRGERVSEVFGTIGTLEHGLDKRYKGGFDRNNILSDRESPNPNIFSSQKRVPMFQLFQSGQNDLSDQQLNHWNKCWNIVFQPDELFQNQVPDPVALSVCSKTDTTKLQSSSACRLPVTVDDWCVWLDSRLRCKLTTSHYADYADAVSDTWSDALTLWRHIHGTVTPKTVCGGCGEALEIRDPTVAIISGARVHASAACLDAYRGKSRQEAADAFAAMGLNSPT